MAANDSPKIMRETVAGFFGGENQSLIMAGVPFQP
jgi:hypothetical protein